MSRGGKQKSESAEKIIFEVLAYRPFDLFEIGSEGA